MPRSVEIMRVETDINKFLRRPRSAYRRFTRVNLCYLQHTERASYDRLRSNDKSADLLEKCLSTFTKIVIEYLNTFHYSKDCFAFFNYITLKLEIKICLYYWLKYFVNVKFINFEIIFLLLYQ